MDRKTAIASQLTTYTGKPCKRCGCVKKYTANFTCISCAKNHDKTYSTKNPEKRRATKAGSDKKYFLNNKEKRYEYIRRWKIDNRERSLAYHREYNSVRERAVKMATPSWSEKDEILALYRRAVELCMEVDHIVPIKSSIVCGLHCFDNLQLLSKRDNAKKSNKDWPGKP